MPNIDLIFKKIYLLFSVIGPHAGESETEIFDRKKREIIDEGKSFWLVKSFKAKTEDIQNFCRLASEDGEDIFCIFLEASQKGGAQPTKTSSVASQFSSDNIHWADISKGIRVTGKIDKKTTALVLESLEINDERKEVDLWNYSNLLNDLEPIKFIQGASTICAIEKYNEGMNSRNRKIIAFGRLAKPFAVWLR